MYRIELLSQKELTDLLRRGIRTRTLTITTTDGSNIRLMPNRPVIVSDETIKMNPSILTDPTVKARHIPDKKIVDTIRQEEFAIIELPVDLEVRKVQLTVEEVQEEVQPTVEEVQEEVQPTVEEVQEEISDADIEALLLTPSSNDIEESADEVADAPQQKQVSSKRKRR
jgi:hypothetical protein